MNWQSLTLVTASEAGSPSVEVVTLQEAKDHLRIDGTDEDDYLETLIRAARIYAEAETGRSFLTQTWRMTFDRFPDEREGIIVPYPPLQTVSSIQYVDTAGDTQTLAGSNYQVDTYAQPGRIRPAYGYCWPSTRCDTFNAVTVTFVAGYGDDAADVPADIRHAVKFIVAHLYERREVVEVGSGLNMHQIPMAAQALLGMHRMRAL